MKYLLDTNIIIYYLNDKGSVKTKVSQTQPLSLSISIVTYGELFYGAYKSQRTTSNLNDLYDFCSCLKTVNVNLDVMNKFGQIKSNLAKKGLITHDFDLVIAASALVTNSILVTHNIKHFQHIDNLVIEDWY